MSEPTKEQQHYPADLHWLHGRYEITCVCGETWPCRYYIHPSFPARTLDPEARDLAVRIGLAIWGDVEVAEQGWPELYDAAIDTLRFRRGETRGFPPGGETPRWTVRASHRPTWLPPRYGYFLEQMETATGFTRDRAFVRMWDGTGETFWEGETISLGGRGEVIRV